MANPVHIQSLSRMADAVGEFASEQIELVEAMDRGDMIGPDPLERARIKRRAALLVEAHGELRAMVKVLEGNKRKVGT